MEDMQMRIIRIVNPYHTGLVLNDPDGPIAAAAPGFARESAEGRALDLQEARRRCRLKPRLSGSQCDWDRDPRHGGVMLRASTPHRDPP
jgi:hypothetical protein